MACASFDVGENVRRGGERADAVGHSGDVHGMTSCRGYWPCVPRPRAPKPLIIGGVDRDGAGLGQSLGGAGDHVPGPQVVGWRSEPTRNTGVISPLGSRQSGKSDHQRRRRGDAGNGQGLLLLVAEQGWILEAFGALAHDPQIGVGVIDHCRHHAAEAEIEAHLHHDQHDRKHDADRRGGKAKAVLEQVARGEREIQRHVAPSMAHEFARQCGTGETARRNATRLRAKDAVEGDAAGPAHDQRAD